MIKTSIQVVTCAVGVYVRVKVVEVETGVARFHKAVRSSNLIKYRLQQSQEPWKVLFLLYECDDFKALLSKGSIVSAVMVLIFIIM